MSETNTPIRLLVVDEAIGHGGVERVVLSLLPELAKQCEQLVWMLPNHRLKDLPAKLAEASRLVVEPFLPQNQESRRLTRSIGTKAARLLRPVLPAVAARIEESAHDSRLEELIARHRITHLLYPALFTQRFPNVSKPVFAVVHDTNYHPSWKERCLQTLETWTRDAAGLVAISDFTRREVLAAFPGATAPVVTVPNASVPAPGGATRLPARAPGSVPTLYYPATFGPHKNHAGLLRSLRALHDEGVRFRLLLTGYETDRLLENAYLDVPTLEDARQRLAAAPPAFKGSIEVKGMVDPAEVERCYADADVVVLPTRYEGFGLPLCEAIGRGRPVVCSDIPAFREQATLYGFGEAISFVEDGSSEAWTAQLRVALTAPPKFPYSSDELDRIFRRWTWADSAKQYLSVLASSKTRATAH